MNLRPDSFRRDWYGYVTSQAGHAYFVGIIGALIFPGMLGVAVVGIVYALTWEWGYQRWRWPDLFDWRDSLEDSIHVLVGAAVLSAVLMGDVPTAARCLVAQSFLLAVGVWRRS